MTSIARSLLRSSLAVTLLALGIFLLAEPVTAQAPKGAARLIPEKDFTKDGREDARQFQAMRKGEQPPAADVLNRAAQWYVYRLTWTEYQDTSGKAGDRSIRDIAQEAMSQIPAVDARKPLTPQQQQFVRDYGKALTARLREVLKNPRPIVRINAAMILARLGEAGYEEVADVLVDILKDPQESDAIKFWALKGLSNLFALSRGPSAQKFNREREERVVRTLLDYLGRNWALPESATPEEQAAVHYIRREVIRTLAETRYPAFEIATKDKKKTFEALTVMALLRVMHKEGVEPPPTVAEQVEAAIGLCQLQGRLLPGDYQADYVAFQVGRFIVEFVNRCLAERDQSKEPWRRNAARLELALDELREDTNTATIPPPIKEYVHKTFPMNQLKAALAQLAAGQTPSAAELNTLVERNPPKSTSALKGVDTAALKTAEKN